MKVGSAIRFFRKNLGYKQKELVNEFLETSSISRIEQNNQEVRISSLSLILDVLSLTFEEFLAKCALNNKQEEWRILINKCVQGKDSQAKKQLITYYNEIKYKNKSLRELSNYIFISMYFSRLWSEIKSLTSQELDEVYRYLKTKKYYQFYDYMIINNTIMNFEDEKQKIIIPKTIPISDEKNRDESTKKLAYNIIINLITSKLYEQEYDGAKFYLKLAENCNNQNYSFKMNIEYLKNLYGYLMTGNTKFLKNVFVYIESLEVIGENKTVEALTQEVKHLIYKQTYNMSDNNFPVDIAKL